MLVKKAHKLLCPFLVAALLLAAFQQTNAQSPTPTPQANDAARTKFESIRSEGQGLVASGSPVSLRSAIDKYVAAAAEAKAANLKYYEALFYSLAGEVYLKLGQDETALKYFHLETQVGQTEDKYLDAFAIRQMALIYSDHADHGEALRLLYIEVELREQMGDVNGELEALHNAAMILNRLGDIERARNTYEGIIELASQVEGNELLVASSTNNLAYVYYRMGDHRKAIELYQKAFDLGVKGGFEEVKAAASIGLGDGWNKLNDLAKSVSYYERGLELARKMGQRTFEGDALYGLGNAYRSKRENRKALEYFDKALAIQAAMGAHEQESMTLSAEMLALRDLGETELAILYGKAAVNVNQAIRKLITGLTKDLQRLYAKSKEQTYRDLSAILIKAGRLPEAEAVLDLLKEQEFGQFTLLRGGETPDTVPYSRIESNVIAKIEHLAELGRRQAELEGIREEKGALSDAEQAELSNVLTDLEAANKAFRSALDALSKADSSVEDKIAEIKTEKNLQRVLGKLRRELNTGIAAIYTVIGSETGSDGSKAKFGWAILVTPEGRKAYPINVADLENTVQQFRTVLSSDKYDPQPLAQKLYNAIFRQTSAQQKTTLESDLNVLMSKYRDRTIMWSLDGALRYVPMAALHDGKQYLAEKYRSSVFTKQSLLLLDEKDAPKWETLGLGVSEEKVVDNVRFAALGGTKRELQDIVKQSGEKTGILDGTRVLNDDFTKQNAIRLWREGKYQAVHIASHYSFNPLDQAASFLVVGDGKLTFADIQDKDNLFGSVDLLTLSACDTGMSSNGKESEGFPFLAQSLGAKTVIASLWKVSDEGTPELMVRFYKLRAANPQMAKGEAFRQAQLSLLRGEGKPPVGAGTAKSGTSGERSDPVDLGDSPAVAPPYVRDPAKPYAHPHYWASFVLIGNWR